VASSTWSRHLVNVEKVQKHYWFTRTQSHVTLTVDLVTQSKSQSRAPQNHPVYLIWACRVGSICYDLLHGKSKLVINTVTQLRTRRLLMLYLHHGVQMDKNYEKNKIHLLLANVTQNMHHERSIKNRESQVRQAQQNKQAMREAATICPAPCKLTFDLESGVRVTCDVGYLCANFSLPRPLCSRLRPNVRDRQTSDRQTSDMHHRLMPLP